MQVVAGVGLEDFVGRRGWQAKETRSDRGREVVDRAAQHGGAHTNRAGEVLALSVSRQAEKVRHRRRKLEPLVAAAEVVRDREVDEVCLDGDQPRGQLAEHLLDGESVHRPHAYPGLGLRLASEAYLVGKRSVPGEGGI